jgi:hypothetical protein
MPGLGYAYAAKILLKFEMSIDSHLAPFSTRPKKPGFSTKNSSLYHEPFSRNPVFHAGARSE